MELDVFVKQRAWVSFFPQILCKISIYTSKKLSIHQRGQNQRKGHQAQPCPEHFISVFLSVKWECCLCETADVRSEDYVLHLLGTWEIILVFVSALKGRPMPPMWTQNQKGPGSWPPPSSGAFFSLLRTNWECALVIKEMEKERWYVCRKFD